LARRPQLMPAVFHAAADTVRRQPADYAPGFATIRPDTPPVWRRATPIVASRHATLHYSGFAYRAESALTA